MTVSLRYLDGGVRPEFLKFIMWREAYNLWLQRGLPRRVAGWAAMRESEGKNADHLWVRVPDYVASAKAYAAELDRLGWLTPIERILKTERFRRTYGKG
jgi:hypothetical protein